jgi:hypothetical protein
MLYSWSACFLKYSKAARSSSGVDQWIRASVAVKGGPHLGRQRVGSLGLTASLVPDERDGFRHYLVGGEDLVRHPLAPVAFHNLTHAQVVGIVPGEKREEEAGVEEDHL